MYLLQAVAYNITNYFALTKMSTESGRGRLLKFFLKTRAPLPRRCPGDQHTGRRGGCSTGLPPSLPPPPSSRLSSQSSSPSRSGSRAVRRNWTPTVVVLGGRLSPRRYSELVARFTRSSRNRRRLWPLSRICVLPHPLHTRSTHWGAYVKKKNPPTRVSTIIIILLIYYIFIYYLPLPIYVVPTYM